MIRIFILSRIIVKIIKRIRWRIFGKFRINESRIYSDYEVFQNVLYIRNAPSLLPAENTPQWRKGLRLHSSLHISLLLDWLAPVRGQLVKRFLPVTEAVVTSLHPDVHIPDWNLHCSRMKQIAESSLPYTSYDDIQHWTGSWYFLKVDFQLQKIRRRR